MRHEFVDLLNCAKALELKATGESGPRCVRFGIDKDTIPERLLALQKAVEAADRVSGSATDPTFDPEKLRAAVDGLVRWISLQGLSAVEATEVIAGIMNGGTRKKSKRYITLPRFAPQSVRKKKTWKPKTLLGVIDMEDDPLRSMGDHEQRGRDMDEVTSRMGHCATR